MRGRALYARTVRARRQDATLCAKLVSPQTPHYPSPLVLHRLHVPCNPAIAIDLVRFTEIVGKTAEQISAGASNSDAAAFIMFIYTIKMLERTRGHALLLGLCI